MKSEMQKIVALSVTEAEIIECEIPKQSTLKENLMSRRCSEDIKVKFPLSNVYNKVKSYSCQSITKFNDSNGTTTTEIIER